jgi:hypothetical protein
VAYREILARERSSASLTAEEYRHLESQEDFWRLVEAGVVALERSASRRFGLKASAFVGRALVGDRLLSIEEKIPGALATLVSAAAEIDARIVSPPAFADRSGHVVRQIAERFLGGVSDYVTAGRQKRYRRESFEAGLPRGKVELGRTMRLRANGRNDLLAFSADVLTADHAVNRLLGLGLNAADVLSASWTDAEEFRFRTRTLAVLFEDVAWPQIAPWSHDRLDESFRAVVGQPETSAALSNTLSLARLLVLHFGVGPRLDQHAPVSWFVNLETLFEDAVRAELSRAVRAPVKVSDWKAYRRHVLTEPSGEAFRAEPDVVISTPSGPAAVLDAKYKDLEDGAKPSPQDVYQLLAHAQAFAVPVSVLLYPGSDFVLWPVGDTAEGHRLFAAKLSLTDLSSSTRALVAHLGFAGTDLEAVAG